MVIDMDSWTRLRAYEIWDSEGRPDGRALEHWLAAEASCRPPAASRVRAKAPRRAAQGVGEGTAELSTRPTRRRTKATAAAV